MKEITHYAYLQNGEQEGMLVKYKDGSGAVIWEGKGEEQKELTVAELEALDGPQPVYEITDKALAEWVKLTS